MKAYIWLSVLIVSVLVAGALLSRTLPGASPPAHAEGGELHAKCDHAHGAETHAPAASAHGTDSVNTTSAPSGCATAEHNHMEEDHVRAQGDAEEENHAEHGHAEHEHATHAEPQSACAGDGHEHAEDPHAGHAHAKAADGICPEHQVLEAEDALCLSDHIGELSPGAGMLVRLASPQVGVRAGIRTTTPEAVQLSESFQV